MANVLEKIISDKRREVHQKKQALPLEQLKERLQGRGKCRNFYKAVTKPNPRGINIIAEVKRASPSAGLIRSDFDPVDIAIRYQKCRADAISVLTDQKYFQGKTEYIQQIKQHVNLPVLRKEFIVDRWQVYESRWAGADAILLIADVLKPAELMDLLITANELTLTSLVEVYQPETLLKVCSMIGFPKYGYSILGINNRNLETMQVDINTTTRLLSLAENIDYVVAESGIKTRGDVEHLKKAGVSACLIGQTLCESPSIENKFKELFD